MASKNKSNSLNRGRRLVSAISAVPTLRGRPKGSFKRGIPATQSYKQAKFRNDVLQRIQQREFMRQREKGYTIEDVKRFSEKDIIRNMPVSANTLKILDRIREIQNMGKVQNIEMQRRIKERRMVGNAMNLLKTPSLFKEDSATINPLDMQDNILNAPNAFKERADIPNLMNTKRPSILNTRETGNDLKF